MHPLTLLRPLDGVTKCRVLVLLFLFVARGLDYCWEMKWLCRSPHSGSSVNVIAIYSYLCRAIIQRCELYVRA